MLTGIKLVSKFKTHITWHQFGCSHNQHFLWTHWVFVQHMLLYKNAQNLEFPHLVVFVNAYCHKPITVLRAISTELNISTKYHICYFYLPKVNNDKKETHRSLHMPKAGQWSIREHSHIRITMNTPQHGQLGLDRWTQRRGGKHEEKAEVNWLEAIPFCRGIWKEMEGLQRSPI